MKIIIIVISIFLLSCTERISYSDPAIITSCTKRICCKGCVYAVGAQVGEFYDDCGKFNVGDTVTTTKKKNK